MAFIGVTCFQHLTASEVVEVRTFNSSELNEIAASDDFYYLKPQTPDPNYFQQFMLFVLSILERIFGNKVAMGILQNLNLIFYVAIFILVIYIIMKTNHLTFNKLFYKQKKKKADMLVYAADEDIKYIDFQKLIQEALKRNDLKTAIRYHYLEILNIMSKREMIKWNPDKTNRDYIMELTGQSISSRFSKLAIIFDYVWYGDFQVTKPIFEGIQNEFISFKNQISG